MANITAIVIAKDEEQMIVNCLETLGWCDQVLVINNGSSDRTEQLSEQWGAKVVNYASQDFAKLREVALKYIKTDWIFYVDADERVSPQLAKEISVNIETQSADAFTLKRKNICYGYELQHGGFGQDLVTRIFKKAVLEGWTGEIHESPVYRGEVKELQTKLLHLTHRSTQDNLFKSAQWTIKEAHLLADSGVKPVKFMTLIRKGVMEFVRRAYLKKGYKDGLPGMIEALVQGMNRIMVYIQVWELQQKPDLEKRYQREEEKIVKEWSRQK
jgi:glycosyltransferase involved in cell wall biosynthesis